LIHSWDLFWMLPQRLPRPTGFTNASGIESVLRERL
jgi:hypothetical protein